MKFNLMLIMCLFVTQIWGQLITDAFVIYPGPAIPEAYDGGRQVLETVNYPTFGDECARDLVTVGIEAGWGRVSGMNFFGDLEKAQKLQFEGSDQFTVVGAIVYFEGTRTVGNGLLNCKIYSVDPTNGGPLALKGFSDAIRVSEVVQPDSIARPTQFSFESGVEVALSEPTFFVSVDFSNLYRSQDTVVILQTIPECGVGTDTWELFADGTTWVPISSSLSWEMNADFLISAVVDFNDPTNTEAYIKDRILTLSPPFPSPATEGVTIRYMLDMATSVHISIFDPTGQLVREINYDLKPTGMNEEVLNITSMVAGTYLYTIRTNSGSLSNRFVVQ